MSYPASSLSWISLEQDQIAKKMYANAASVSHPFGPPNAVVAGEHHDISTPFHMRPQSFVFEACELQPLNAAQVDYGRRARFELPKRADYISNMSLRVKVNPLEKKAAESGTLAGDGSAATDLQGENDPHEGTQKITFSSDDYTQVAKIKKGMRVTIDGTFRGWARVDVSDGVLYIELEDDSQKVLTAHVAETKQFSAEHRVHFCNSLGHALIEKATLMAGSQEIEELTGEWLEVYEEAFSVDSQLQSQIGKVHAFDFGTKKERIMQTQKKLYTWAQKEQIMHIPLKFFFEERGRALALSKLQGADLFVDIEFRSKDKLIQKSSGDLSGLGGGAGFQKATDDDIKSDSGKKGEIQGAKSCLVVEYATVNQAERRSIQRNEDSVVSFARTQFSGAYNRKAEGDLRFDPKLRDDISEIIVAERAATAEAANSLMDFTGCMAYGRMSDKIGVIIENADYLDESHSQYHSRVKNQRPRTVDSSICRLRWQHGFDDAECGGGAIDFGSIDHEILVEAAPSDQQKESKVFCWGRGPADLHYNGRSLRVAHSVYQMPSRA